MSAICYLCTNVFLPTRNHLKITRNIKKYILEIKVNEKNADVENSQKKNPHTKRVLLKTKTLDIAKFYFLLISLLFRTFAFLSIYQWSKLKHSSAVSWCGDFCKQIMKNLFNNYSKSICSFHLQRRTLL